MKRSLITCAQCGRAIDTIKPWMKIQRNLLLCRRCFGESSYEGRSGRWNEVSLLGLTVPTLIA